jgi:glucose/arabinose dehydrogenase
MIFKMRSAREISVLIIAALIVVLAFPVIAQESSEEEHTVGVELAVDGLTSPVDMAMPDDGSGRIFIVDQVGPIWILAPNGELMSEPFLDLSDKIVELNPDYDERGVLGLAFHPDYDENGRFFVYYTIPLREDAPEDWAHTNVVSEFSVSSDNPDQADPDSERIIWEHDHPSSNHNAGHITFGPDGYLYIPYGDGGGADDTGRGHTPDIGNGQDVTNLFGTILRIDMDTDDSGEPLCR